MMGRRVPPRSDPAHMKSRGAGGDARHLVPLCRDCHMRQHSKGIITFFAENNVSDHMELAEIYEQRWLESGQHEQIPSDLDF